MFGKEIGDNMKVDVNRLKEEVNGLKTIIDNYEEVYLNLYHELDTVSSSWRDTHASLFFDTVKFEKLSIQTTIAEMREIITVYNDIIVRYSKIGNKITFDLSSKSEIISKCNHYIDILNDIIRKYNDINVSSYSTESQYIVSERHTLEQTHKDVVELKEKINSKFQLIEQLEKEISRKINKIKIEVMKENSGKKWS